MNQIDAATPVTMTMTAEQWNGVLLVMGESPMPYRLSAPLIESIRKQLQVAAAQAAQPVPNGAERLQYAPVA